MRLHSNNIYRDSGIEIPEAWMPTKKKNMTTDLTYLYHGGPPGDQFLPLTMPIMLYNAHQP